MRSGSFCIALTLLSCLHTESAAAHAPLARSIRPTPKGVHVWMPSFGVVFHADDEQARSYACSAQLELALEEQRLEWLSSGDGSVWLASQRGLHNVSADGCSTFALTDEWTKRPIAALAKHPSQAGVLYVVTTDMPPALYRSADDGKHWQLTSTLAAAPTITALHVVSGRTTELYLSRSTKESATVERSTDEGVTWSTVANGYAQDLTLRQVRPGLTDALWATATAPGSRETRLLVAPLQGEFREVKRVRYFGGFAMTDDGGTLWIADETGGLFRSEDQGKTFVDTQPELAVGCLSFDPSSDALWACTPGLTDEPAVSVSHDRGASFSAGAAFAEVERLVSCPAPANVAQSCAAAWNEWQADVRMLATGADAASPMPTAILTADAGTSPRDAGSTHTTRARDAGPSEEPMQEHVSQAAGCSVGRGRASRFGLLAGLWLACAIVRRRQIRRTTRARVRDA